MFLENSKNSYKIVLITSLSILFVSFPAFSQKRIPVESNCFIKTSKGKIITIPNCGTPPPQTVNPTRQIISPQPQNNPANPVLPKLTNEPLFNSPDGQARLWGFIEGISNTRNLFGSDDEYFKIQYPSSSNSSSSVRIAVVNGSVNCDASTISLRSGTAYNSQTQPINRNFSLNETVTLSPVSLQRYCKSKVIPLKPEK